MHRIYQILSGYILSSMSNMKPIRFIIFYAIYDALCNQATHSSFDDCENIVLHLISSSNRKYELLAVV